MSAVRDRLREAPLPREAEAAARSWPVVEAALAERSPSVPGRRVPVRLALVLALLCIGLATALSPAGAWIGDRLKDETSESKPAFAALPEGGPVLAITRNGAYAVRPDGSTRRLGSFSEAGSSGLGYAVAYLEGSTLRVVAGDGDPATDRPVRRRAASVTPAWRPHSDRVLTYAAIGGAIETIDVETGRRLWRTSPSSARPRSLAWSRDGRRLVALSSRSATVLGATGRVLRTIALPGVGRELALHPSGRRAAVVVARGPETGVLGVRLAGAGRGTTGAVRQLFQGNVDSIAWSQDGRWLLLGWRGAGQWLLLGPHGRIRALHGVTGELGAPGGFPRVAGWCCAS